jgi:hypothetical protein
MIGEHEEEPPVKRIAVLRSIQTTDSSPNIPLTWIWDPQVILSLKEPAKGMPSLSPLTSERERSRACGARGPHARKMESGVPGHGRHGPQSW